MKHINQYIPFDANNYKNFFNKEYQTQLGAVTFDEAKVIYFAFKLIPKSILKGLVSIIEFDPSLGKSKKIYPNHGRWEDNFKTMVLNRSVIDLEPEESKHLIIHEVGHAVDNKLGEVSKTDPWLKLSGWSMDPPNMTIVQKSNKNYLKHGNLKRLKIEDNNLTSVSDWWFDENAGFVRWYASRNPEEDLAESFAYYILDEKNRFKDCKNKYDFIKNTVLKDI